MIHLPDIVSSPPLPPLLPLHLLWMIHLPVTVSPAPPHPLCCPDDCCHGDRTLGPASFSTHLISQWERECVPPPPLTYPPTPLHPEAGVPETHTSPPPVTRHRPEWKWGRERKKKRAGKERRMILFNGSPPCLFLLAASAGTTLFIFQDQSFSLLTRGWQHWTDLCLKCISVIFIHIAYRNTSFR